MPEQFKYIEEKYDSDGAGDKLHDECGVVGIYLNNTGVSE